jgi:hypothetical protein
MKTIRSVALAVGIASTSVFGWIIEEPIDYPKQLQSADFVGLVEVTRILETGNKKVLYDGSVHFRELTLELKVMSAFKGKGETVTCRIYREPSREELIADGVAESDVMKILLNLGTDEMLHLFPARVTQRDHLLVYLRSTESIHVPVTGELNSSRSLLRLEPSNMAHTLDRKQQAEQVVPPNRSEAPSLNSKSSARSSED